MIAAGESLWVVYLIGDSEIFGTLHQDIVTRRVSYQFYLNSFFFVFKTLAEYFRVYLTLPRTSDIV